MVTFDEHWKIMAVSIAAVDFGSLDKKRLFERAEDIYYSGYFYGFDQWKNPYAGVDRSKIKTIKPLKKAQADTKKVIKEEIEQKPTAQIAEAPKETIEDKVATGTKTCPGCNEQVPSGWSKHSFKKDGTMCGQQL